MEESSFRVEWRTTEEQLDAGAALAQGWSFRRVGWWALGCAAVALLALLAPSACTAAGLALPCLFFAYAFGALYRQKRARVDREKIRGWIEARRKHKEGFREPARDIEEARTATLTIDRDGIEISRAELGVLRRPWSAVYACRALSDGHVVFLTTGTIGIFVPAWAFESDEQRATLLARAKALRAAASPNLAPDSAPPLTSNDAFEIAIPASMTVARRTIASWGLPLYATYAVLAYSFGSTVGSLAAHRVRIVEWLPPAAAVVFALVLTSPWLRAWRAWRGQRRHVVHRLRFSQMGASWASALGSEIRPWKSVQLVRAPGSIRLFGLTRLDYELEPEQLDAILGWSEAEPPTPPPKTDTRSHRWLVLAVFLGLIAFAAYQLVANDDPPPRPWVGPLVEEAHAPVAPECELPAARLPGETLSATDIGECDGLVPLLPHVETRIERCAIVDHSAIDRAAVILRPDLRWEMWLRAQGHWRTAGLIAAGDHCLAPEALSLLQPSDAPEILVSMECFEQRHEDEDLSLQPRYRVMSGCGPRGSDLACWTVTIASEEHYDPWLDETEPGRSCKWLEVELRENALSFSAHACHHPASAREWASAHRVTLLPEGTYTLGELSRLDELASER